MHANTWRDGIITAAGLLVLVIGTATGNAYLMLGAAVAALVVLAALYRQQFTSRRSLVLLAATITAVATATVTAAFLSLP